MKQKFSISGMTCAACSASVDRSVRKLPGIQSVNVSLLTNSMTVDYDPAILDSSRIIQAVRSAGYGASLMGSAEKAVSPMPRSADILSKDLQEMRQRLIVSLVFLVPLLYVSLGFHLFRVPLPATAAPSPVPTFRTDR